MEEKYTDENTTVEESVEEAVKKPKKKKKRRTEEQQKKLNEFAHRIYNLRVDRGLSLNSLEQISKNQFHIRVAKGTWSKYENGEEEPGLSKLLMISQIYGVTLDYLVGNVDDPHGTLTEPKAKDMLTNSQSALIDAYGKANDVQQSVVKRVLNIREHNTVPNKK